MDLHEFATKYGNHKITYKESNWIMLQIGNVIQAEDEAHGLFSGTWNKVHPTSVGKVYDDRMVSIRRKGVTAQTNPLKFLICPVCGNSIPAVITRCADCGHTM